jgi:uncharacterized membrane-anchored protein YhcB (DUF1043 family)
MSGWAIALIIILVLGVVVGNLMLLKQTAKMKVPEEILRAVQERKKKELQEEQQKEKKPKDK